MLGTAWSIRDLYVAPQCRRSGIARTLLQHAVDHARAAGWPGLRVQRSGPAPGPPGPAPGAARQPGENQEPR